MPSLIVPPRLRPLWQTLAGRGAVGAVVTAAAIGVGRQRGIFAGLPFWRVDDRAAFDRHAVGVQAWHILSPPSLGTSSGGTRFIIGLKGG